MLMSYGEQFRRLRQRAGLTQEQVAKALRYKRAAPVSLLERTTARLPRARTIKIHATALRCEPWELLAGVPTDYDRLRTRTPLSDEELGILLWGLASLEARDRRVVLEQMQSFVPALPTPGQPKRGARSDPAKPQTGARTRQTPHQRRA